MTTLGLAGKALGRKRVLLGAAVLFLIATLFPLVFSGTAENLFLDANSQYEKGDYAGAAETYRKIIDYGIRNETVYYNLGNAYFKQNQIGEAILYYEKALKLDPRDREAAQNLELANLLKYDRVEQKELSPPLKLALWLHNLLSLNAQLIVGLILFYISSFAFASLMKRRRLGLSLDLPVISLIVLLLLLALLSLSAGIKIYGSEHSSLGIVLTDKVDVLSGPGEANAVLFPVHEGLKVRVRSEKDTWYQISLPNGLNGWVKKKNIGMI